jgi:hypothetical protein
MAEFYRKTRGIGFLHRCLLNRSREALTWLLLFVKPDAFYFRGSFVCFLPYISGSRRFE